MTWSVTTRKRLAITTGYICIAVFFSLTTYIITVFYKVLVPALLERKEYLRISIHFIFGNWLAINIYFNHIMAWLSSPGYSKDYQDICKQNHRCRKCSMKKAPRTHHCGWCDRCVLKYDHHCPWLNNCVGFYNHRYFFQFSTFMMIGCFYAGTFGYREYQIALLGSQKFSYIDSFLHPFILLDALDTEGFVTYFIFVAAFTISFLLLFLVLWHGRMISIGVTSLERFTNELHADECSRQGYIFVNPYNFGFIENWKRFFAVSNIRSFICRVLLPSTHKPYGDGMTWEGFNVNKNLQAHSSPSSIGNRPLAYPPGIDPNFPGRWCPVRPSQPVFLPSMNQNRPIHPFVPNYRAQAPQNDDEDIKKTN